MTEVIDVPEKREEIIDVESTIEPVGPFLSTLVWFDIGDVKKAPWNFKADATDPELVTRFKASLERGVTPLQVAQREEERDVYEVCDGNHRLDALREMGVLRILAFNHGLKTIAERKELGLRYNGEWFFPEAVPLAECLRDVIEATEELVIPTLSYDEPELDRLLAVLNIDLTPLPDNDDLLGGEGASSVAGKVRKEKSVKTVECPHCGKAFNL